MNTGPRRHQTFIRHLNTHKKDNAMTSKTQDPKYSTLIGRDIYSPALRCTVTITDYAPGNVWCFEASIGGRAVAWVSLDEIDLPADMTLSAGDTVVVSDDANILYVGHVTRVDGDNVTAYFQGYGKRRFTMAYIVQVIPAHRAADLIAAV